MAEAPLHKIFNDAVNDPADECLEETNIEENNIEETNNDYDEVINDEQFEDMRELLDDDFVALVEQYLNDSKKRIADLYQAHLADDNAQGFEIAHTLKGASASLGATELMKLSDQLQEACRHRTINQQDALIAQLSDALDRLKQAIQQRLSL